MRDKQGFGGKMDKKEMEYGFYGFIFYFYGLNMERKGKKNRDFRKRGSGKRERKNRDLKWSAGS